MRRLFIWMLISTSIGIVVAPVQGRHKEGSLNISHIELGYPHPAIPFYHLKADLALPEPSMIEVEVTVNGKNLRFVNLYKGDLPEEVDKPGLSHRPPSGYALSQDNSLYNNPRITAWVKWSPGETYNIEIRVRMKKKIKPSSEDRLLTAAKKVKAPEGVALFDPAWKGYKSVVVSETAGMERKNEVVEVLLPFYPDEVNDLKREIRVVSVDPEKFSLSEAPSQVFDIQKYAVTDDLDPLEERRQKRHIPLWMPTVTCKVAFLSDMTPHSSKVYLIYYNNPKAMNNSYHTDLRVQGELPGLTIDNKFFNIVLHPNSGHIDQITLKSKADFPFFHRMETNGAIHWNPGIYVPPKAWTHTADWKKEQNMYSISGPVLATGEFWGNLRNMPEVDASVRYDFFPGVPYFFATTDMMVKETLQTLALRNAEICLKRELITHAAWYDIIRKKVITFDVGNMTDLTDLKMEADVPWITFYNQEIGIGFAGINLEYANVSLQSRKSLLNPYMYITGGPWIYWARALSLSFLSSNMQQVIPVKKGSIFHEKWAFLVYETDETVPYSPVLEWEKRIKNPLRLRLEEEVDERVSKSLVEIYMDEGKSGWEERETGNH